jgi:hypothetical protein
MNRGFKRVLQQAQRARRTLAQGGRDMGMDKYGYDQNGTSDNSKTAAEKGKYPECGSELTGNPPVCPKCGSAPFEKKEKK